MTKEAYLLDPCGTSSLPWWKGEGLQVPENMALVHDRAFDPKAWTQWQDITYFRLLHDLTTVDSPVFPRGFSLREGTLTEFADHIRLCYPGTNITEVALAESQSRRVYEKSLWVAVFDDATGAVAATGIGEWDREMGEGSLEWIQVSPQFRRRGLGRYVVLTLLGRLQGKARFATVSGQTESIDCPERLYRACGFRGRDVWHILRKKEAK